MYFKFVYVVFSALECAQAQLMRCYATFTIVSSPSPVVSSL